MRQSWWLVAAVAALIGVARPVAGQTRRAVLVGIDTYLTPAAAGQRPLGRSRDAFADLRGTVNDVEAVRSVLVARFGFKPSDVHLVENQTATREHILWAVQKWLIDDASAGDVSFFYYAGHGSQVRNSRSLEPDKLDESIVPADSSAGAPDIRDKEIAQLFGKALDKHVLLTVGFDSCHSGSISRGLLRPVRIRGIVADAHDAADPSNPPSLESRGAVVLAASQSQQPAEEMVDEDGTAHGLFTWALLKALRSMPLNESVEQMYLAVRGLVHSSDPSQDPDLSAPASRKQAPLFGDAADTAGPDRVAVRSISSDGTVTLEGGLALGLRAGSELETVEESGGKPAVLRVAEALNLAVSHATLVSGDRERLSPGTLLKVTKWASPDNPLLRVWTGPSLKTAAILSERTQLEDLPDVEFLEDPTTEAASEPATAVVCWDGSAWDVRLGAKTIAHHAELDPQQWLTDVPTDQSGKKVVFLDLPIAAELQSNLKIGDSASNDAIALVPDADAADYVLVGRRVQDHVEYAWVRPSVGTRTSSSTLPARSDWIALNLDKPDGTAKDLQQETVRLAFIKNWLEMDSPAGSSRIPYHLALQDASSGTIRTSGPVHGGESYNLVLTLDRAGDSSHISPQYVYVFIIDSSGQSTVLYPTLEEGGGENQFPQRDETGQFPRQIRLGRGGIKIQSPFGSDTYIMLTTSTPLPDAFVLSSKPVLTRAAGVPADPLSRLLHDAASGRRGAGIQTPTDWSIERLVIESVAAPGKNTGAQKK